MYKAIEMSKIDNLQKIFNIHRILLMFATVSTLHGPAIIKFILFPKKNKERRPVLEFVWKACTEMLFIGITTWMKLIKRNLVFALKRTIFSR